MGFIGLDLGKDHLCGKAEKVACTGSDKCHDKGWLKAIFFFKKKKKDKEATWEALCVNYKANAIY